MRRSGSEQFHRFKGRVVTGESERLVLLIEQEEDGEREKEEEKKQEGREKRGEDLKGDRG